MLFNMVEARPARLGTEDVGQYFIFIAAGDVKDLTATLVHFVDICAMASAIMRVLFDMVS